MKKSIFLSLTMCCLSQFFFSCENKKEKMRSDSAHSEYPIHVPFEKGLETERDLKLSELADSVRLIPLETTDVSLLNRIMNGGILKSSKYWFLYSYKNVYQFTNEGKFVRIIGSRGNGPGEYTSVSCIDIDESLKHVYVLSPGKNINVYDMETGTYLYTRKAPSFSSWAFAMLNDSVSSCFQYNLNGQEKARILVADAEGDTIKAFSRSDLFQNKTDFVTLLHFNDDRYMFRYKDMVCYKEYYNDTLFVVTADSLLPRYVFDLGKHSMPVEHRPEALGFDKKAFKSLSSSYIRTQALETESWIFMPYSYWQIESSVIDDMHLLVYDKRRKECFKVRGGVIINDLCAKANIPFCPQNTVAPNILISLLSAEEIFEMAEDNPSILNHPQLKGLAEDSNPILMVVYLK